ELAIHACANKPLARQALKDIPKFSFLMLDDWRQQQHATSRQKSQQPINNFASRLLTYWRAGQWVMDLSQMSVEQAKVIVDLCRCGDGGSRIGAARSLLNCDSGREAFDVIDFRFL